MVQPAMSSLNETKEWTYTIQYSSTLIPNSSFFGVVPPDEMSVDAGSPIVVVGGVRLVILSADAYAEGSARLSARGSRDRDVSSPPLQVLELGHGTMGASLSVDRLHSKYQFVVEYGPIGDESCGERQRCWAELCVVVCVWVCMLLNQWYKLSLRSMLWSSRGEETDGASDNRSQQGMQIFLPLVGIKMAPTELVEPVLYGYSLSNKSNGYILSRCGAPLDKTGAYVKTSNDGIRNEFLATVIDNIGQMDCAKTTDAQGNLLYLDNSCDGGNDDLPQDTTLAQILQSMQTNAGNGEGLLLSTNSNGEIVSPEVRYRQPALRIQTDSTLKLLKFIDPNKRDNGRTYSYLAIENNGRTTTTQPLYLAAYARADKRLGQYGTDEGLQNITIFKEINSSHIRFVLDGSGSMSACIIWDDETSSNGSRKFWGGNGYIWTNQVCALTRMETLIDELYALVSALPENTQIGLEMFSSSNGYNHNNQWSLSENNLARLGDSGVRESAQEWVLSLDDVENVGNWGGTIPWPALKRAFDDQGADTVYFLSDGVPNSFSGNGLPSNVYDEDRVVNYFTDLNATRDQSGDPKLIVNTIALGLKSDWMQQFSEKNNGNYIQYDSESLSEVNS